MEKRVELLKEDTDRSLMIKIAEGTSEDFGIRGEDVFSTAGDIVAEYYVCIKDAEGYSECEYSDIILVHRGDKESILSMIRQEYSQREEDIDWEILRYFEKNFSSLNDIRHWLLKNHIPYRNFHDSNWGTYPSKPSEGDAEQLARLAHADQKDKAGADYIEHPLRVASTFTDDNEEDHEIVRKLRVVAFLHDVLEDTWVTREYLERCGYEEDIIAAIEALTKLPDEEGSDAGYEKFVHRATQNPLAIRVKMADIRDNMDVSRLPESEHSSAEVRSRMARYQKALAYLQDVDASPSTEEIGLK